MTTYGETRTEERLIIFHYRFLDADNSNGATFKQSFQLCHRTKSAKHHHKLQNSFRGIYLLNNDLKNKEDLKRCREEGTMWREQQPSELITYQQRTKKKLQMQQQIGVF